MNSELVKEYFGYENGILFWKKCDSTRVKVGDRVSTKSLGYTTLEFKGKSFKVHQIVFLMFNGYMPSEIDHINGERSDNRIENLRAVNRQQNSSNQRVQKRSVSGFKGVTKHKASNKWRARIKVNQKEIYLGVYESKELAAQAYNNAAIEHFGNFASLNNIKE